MTKQETQLGNELEWFEAVYWLRETQMRGLQPETKLKSEDVLVSESNRFSKATIRRALHYLVGVGELESRRGSGYKIKFNKVNNVSFTHFIKPLGRQFDETDISGYKDDAKKISAFTNEKYLDEVQESLGLSDHEKVKYFSTTRFVEGRALLISRHYIRADKIHHKEFSERLKEGESFSRVMREIYGGIYKRKYRKFETRLPDAEEQEILSIGPYDVIFETRGVNVDNQGDTIEFNINLWPAHLWNMKMEF